MDLVDHGEGADHVGVEVVDGVDREIGDRENWRNNIGRKKRCSNYLFIMLLLSRIVVLVCIIFVMVCCRGYVGYCVVT